MILDIGELHEWLDRLNWGEGLRAPEIASQVRALGGDLPAWVPLALEQLPSDRLFRGAGEVASYVRHLMRSGVLPGDPNLSPVQPPIGYPDSPTGGAFPSHATQHGVGSGAGSGYTGSDAQTGDSQEGVDYTAEK
jgi:hypothetical protein